MVQIDNNSKILCFRFQWVFNLFLGLHGRLDQRSSNATDLSVTSRRCHAIVCCVQFANEKYGWNVFPK